MEEKGRGNNVKLYFPINRIDQHLGNSYESTLKYILYKIVK